MIHIAFHPDRLEGAQRCWWESWLERAEKASEGVIERWRAGEEIRPKKDAVVYRELAQWLAEEFFAGKCAYCESTMDKICAEHYRPLGDVTVRRDEGKRAVRVRRNKNGRLEDHPGYFWLGFSWQNIFPSCAGCNDAPAKHTQFPLDQEQYHHFPEIELPDCDELDEKESPLLLHPYRDDPSKHLKFLDHGLVVERNNSRQGKTTIEVCKLDRDYLVRMRQREQEAVEIRLDYARGYFRHTQKKDSLEAERLARSELAALYRNEKGPYQEAIRQCLLRQ